MTSETLHAIAFFKQRHEAILQGAGGIPNVPVDAGEELHYLPLEEDYGVMADAVGPRATVDMTADMTDTRILVPEDPFSMTKSETAGYPISDMWRYIYGCPVCRGPVKTVRPMEARVSWIKNWEWLNGRNGMTVGKIGEDFVRPRAPTIVDLMNLNSGWDILEAAHALTHLQSEHVAARTKWTFGTGERSFDLFENLVRIVLSLKFGLVLDVSPKSSGERIGLDDAFKKYGILVAPTTQFANPCSVVAIREGGMMSDKRAVVSAAVKIEPHPHSYNEGGDGWREINRWSCHPSMVDLIGWECCDYVSRQPIVARFDGQKRSEFVLVPQGLQEMSNFHHFLNLAKERLGPVEEDPEHGLMLASTWMESDLLKEMLMRTPPLPCLECMRLNLQAEGSPMKPKCRRPDSKAKPGEQPSPEQVEWDRWSGEVGRICKTVEKAVVYYEGRIYGATAAARRRRRRKSAHSRRTKALRQAASMLRKYKSLMNAGQVTGAEEIYRRREDLLKSLDEV